jgi:hypothetical protein
VVADRFKAVEILGRRIRQLGYMGRHWFWKSVSFIIYINIIIK